VRQDLDQQKTSGSDYMKFIGMALVQIVLRAIDAVSGFMEGVSGKLQNVAGFRCKRCVDGHLFRKLWP